MDVREKLVALLEKFVPTIWYEDCDENRHPECDEIQCSECIADRLIHNGVTITPAVSGAMPCITLAQAIRMVEDL